MFVEIANRDALPREVDRDTIRPLAVGCGALGLQRAIRPVQAQLAVITRSDQSAVGGECDAVDVIPVAVVFEQHHPRSAIKDTQTRVLGKPYRDASPVGGKRDMSDGAIKLPNAPHFPGGKVNYGETSQCSFCPKRRPSRPRPEDVRPAKALSH